jgi:hypothetical protein
MVNFGWNQLVTQRISGAKAYLPLLAVWILIGVTLLVVWLDASRHHYIPCAADCGETFLALQDARNYRTYGLKYGLLQDLSTTPNLSARPFLYTHNVHIGGIFFVFLEAIGITSIWGKQLVTLLGFGVGLYYVFRTTAYYSRSQWLGLGILFLFCLEYHHVFRFGLHALRAWHWLALCGLLFHVGRLGLQPGPKSWGDRLAITIFAILSFGIGYDFTLISFSIIFILLILHLPHPLSPRQFLETIGWVLVAFAIPIIIRQLQVALVMGPSYWITDMYYTFGIKVSFLNRIMPLPSASEIERFYEVARVFRPPSSPVPSLAELLTTTKDMLIHLVIPTVGLLTFVVFIIGGTTAIIIAGLNIVRSQAVVGWFSHFQTGFDLLGAIKLLTAFCLGISFAATIIAPFFIHFYLKHQFPLLAAPILLTKAIVIALALQFFWSRKTSQKPVGWIGVVIACILVFDHMQIQIDNLKASTPMDVSWIDAVSAKSDASFAVSWISSSVAPFTDNWVVDIKPTRTYHVLERLKSAQLPFNNSDIFFFTERDPNINYLQPDYWLYYRTDEAGKFDYPSPICRHDYITRQIQRIQRSMFKSDTTLRIWASPSQLRSGELILVNAQVDPGPLKPDGYVNDVKFIINNKPAKLFYNCRSKTYFSTYRVPINALTDNTYPVRLVLENGQEFSEEIDIKIGPFESQTIGDMPQPTIEQIIEENPQLKIANQGSDYVIFDLHSIYTSTETTELLPDNPKYSASLLLPSTPLDKIRVGMPYLTLSGSIASFTPNDLVLADQHLFRVMTNSTVSLLGYEGQSITVTNLGPWNQQSQSYSGLPAFFHNGKWHLDTSTFTPINTYPDFTTNTEVDPLAGWWISPADTGYEVIYLHDEIGSFVRIQATEDAPYLVLTKNEPLNTLDEVPISLVVQIRAHSEGKQGISLVDYTSSEKSQWHKDETIATEQWETLTIDGEVVSWPSYLDTYSVGLFEVKAGDWFDVRELSLYIGRLP